MLSLENFNVKTKNFQAAHKTNDSMSLQWAVYTWLKADAGLSGQQNQKKKKKEWRSCFGLKAEIC